VFETRVGDNQRTHDEDNGNGDGERDSKRMTHTRWMSRDALKFGKTVPSTTGEYQLRDLWSMVNAVTYSEARRMGEG